MVKNKLPKIFLINFLLFAALFFTDRVNAACTSDAQCSGAFDCDANCVGYSQRYDPYCPPCQVCSCSDYQDNYGCAMGYYTSFIGKCEGCMVTRLGSCYLDDSCFRDPVCSQWNVWSPCNNCYDLACI